jgi:hypothetical protein
VSIQRIAEVSSSSLHPALGSDLPGSFSLDSIDLLERQLADVNEMQESVVAVTALWTTHSLRRRAYASSTTWFKPVSVGSSTSLGGPADAWRQMARRVLDTLAQLSDELPELGASVTTPTPDPQPVDPGWLSSLSSIRARESSDIYEWYAAMDEE